MRLGPIQQSIVTFLKRCGPNGGCIGVTTRAPEFAGLDLEQVERALQALIRRKIVRRESIRYILND